jgi:hypothetical protein
MSEVMDGPRDSIDDLGDVLTNLREGVDDYTETEIAEEEIRTPASPVGVPDVVARAMASHREELLSVAEFLVSRGGRTMVFHTEIGDIKCLVNWRSCNAQELGQPDRLFLVKLRSDAVVFTPKPGARLRVSFEDRPQPVGVVCLAAPQKLYPGIDIMVFLTQSFRVEKTGKLADGAPSVVSGKPSDTVDEMGEPVVEGEKTADREQVKQAFVRDFDKPRE